MALARLVFGSAIIALALMVPGLARAQTCTTDGDCAKGLSCQTDETVATTAPACFIGDGGTVNCPPVPPVLPPTKSCRLAACTSSADCGPEMTCYTQKVTACSGGTAPTVKCEPNTTCPVEPAPEPETCTDSSISQCLYLWQLPCNADLDCGEGFVCKPTVMGMCSGSTGVGTPSSGGGSSSGAGGATSSTGVAAPAPADLDAGAVPIATCTTVETFPGHCQAKATSCTADSDCPSTWTCGGANVAIAMPSRPDGVDGGVAVAVPPPVSTTTKTCQAPSTYDSRASDPTLGTTTQKGGSESGAVDSGTAVGTNTPPTPNVPGTTNEGPTQQAASTSGGGGCSVALGSGAGSAAWLTGLLLGLAMLVARRRQG